MLQTEVALDEFTLMSKALSYILISSSGNLCKVGTISTVKSLKLGKAK